MNLEVNQRALAADSILIKIEDEEETMKEAERERKRGRRRQQNKKINIEQVKYVIIICYNIFSKKI